MFFQLFLVSVKIVGVHLMTLGSQRVNIRTSTVVYFKNCSLMTVWHASIGYFQLLVVCSMFGHVFD